MKRTRTGIAAAIKNHKPSPKTWPVTPAMNQSDYAVFLHKAFAENHRNKHTEIIWTGSAAKRAKFMAACAKMAAEKT